MQPLEIVFHMRTPVALGHPWIMLDSLLMHARLAEELGERYFSLPTKIAMFPEVDIPLKRWRDIYVASISIFEPSDLNTYVFSFFKRGDFPFPSGKVSRGSGFFKDFYLKVIYIPAARVRFYATGEPEEVSRLLSKLPALGKERNIGFGFVKKVEVNVVEHEWGLVRDGKAMRPIPVKHLRSFEDAVRMPCRPPYWSKHSAELCAVPFTRVELL